MRISVYLQPLLIAVFLCGSSALGQTAQDTVAEDFGFTSESIDWVIPGKFDEALASAKEQNRILLVRALGFGLDELGASCATKGCW